MLQLAYDANCHSHAIEYSRFYLDVINQDEDFSWQDGELSTLSAAAQQLKLAVSLSQRLCCCPTGVTWIFEQQVPRGPAPAGMPNVGLSAEFVAHPKGLSGQAGPSSGAPVTRASSTIDAMPQGMPAPSILGGLC